MKRTKSYVHWDLASDSKPVLRKMVENGMNVARLNFSHGSHEEHKAKMDLVKEVSKELGQTVALLLDTKGPEVRIRQFESGQVLLKEGDPFTLTTKEINGNQEMVSVTYPNLPRELSPGKMILIDDGLIQLRVLEVTDTEVRCVVENGGVLSNNKSINCPDVNISLPAITQKDREDIEFGIREGIDFIAASFVRKADDVIEIRRVLEENREIKYKSYQR